MNRKDLVKSLSKKAHLSNVEADTILSALFKECQQCLSKGDRLLITGIGSLSVRNQKPRKGRNIATGETVSIPARKVVKYHASAELKKIVNSNNSSGIS